MGHSSGIWTLILWSGRFAWHAQNLPVCISLSRRQRCLLPWCNHGRLHSSGGTPSQRGCFRYTLKWGFQYFTFWSTCLRICIATQGLPMVHIITICSVSLLTAQFQDSVPGSCDGASLERQFLARGSWCISRGHLTGDLRTSGGESAWLWYPLRLVSSWQGRRCQSVLPRWFSLVLPQISVMGWTCSAFCAQHRWSHRTLSDLAGSILRSSCGRSQYCVVSIHLIAP